MGLKVEIAEICCQIECSDHFLANLLNYRYEGFFSDKDPVVSIEVEVDNSSMLGGEPPLAIRDPGARISFKKNQIIMEGLDFRGVFDSKTHKGHICIPPLIHPFDWFLRLIYSQYLIKQGGFFLHAAAISKEDKGYVFFGPSGSGKSTVASLSPESCLSDELVIINPVEGCYQVFGTPFWAGENASVPLQGLFALRKSHQVSLTPLLSAQAVAELLSNIEFGLHTPKLTEELFLATGDVVEAVSCFAMHFLPDNSFWNNIEEAL